MKKLFLCLSFGIVVSSVSAQQIEYQTFVYTDPGLADEIQHLSLETERSVGSDMLDATFNATKGIASGWVTSLVDMGVNAIASLVTVNSRHRAEWNAMIEKENVFETTLNTLSDLNDFYEKPSFSGPMDPKGMVFNGIGCLKTEDSDTTFHISCHIDRRKLHRIIDHSKFELVLDTLIISPQHSSLPNTPLDIPFSFDERKDYNFTMSIRITSSWINNVAALQKDQLLGEFTINLPVNPSDLDDDGYFRYIRGCNDEPRYRVAGESFIVPRSFMGFRDQNDEYHDCWGTGEYKVSVTIKETCDITDTYRANWKADYRKRKRMKPSEGILSQGWEMVRNQHWDEMTRSWIITTLKAPAGVVSRTVNESMKYQASGQSSQNTTKGK